MSRLNDDVLSGGVLLLVAVGYGIVALGIPAGDGEPGPSFMPLLLSVALAGLSAVIVVAGLRRSAAAPVAAPAAAAAPAPGTSAEPDTAIAPDDGTETDLPKRPWLAALATVVFVALFQPLGFAVSTAVYCAAVTRLFSTDRRMLITVPVAVTGALFVFFRLVLGVRLPPGLFG